jgi:hypothetical protein
MLVIYGAHPPQGASERRSLPVRDRLHSAVTPQEDGIHHQARGDCEEKVGPGRQWGDGYLSTAPLAEED